MISEVVQTEAIEEQYLTFNLGENLVGIQLKVVEIIEFISEIIPIPRAPDHVLGVANIENAIIPILDLELLLKYKTESLTDTVISIIIAIESAVFGIHIAEPPKVVLLENMIDDPTMKISNDIPKDWIEGYFIDNMDKTVIILNPEKFWIGLGKSEITGPASNAKASKKARKESPTVGTSESKTQVAEKQKIPEAKQAEVVPSKEDDDKKSNKKKKAAKDEVKSEVEKIEELNVLSEVVDKKKSKKKKKGSKDESKTKDKKSEEVIVPSDVVDDKKTKKKKTKDSENDTKQLEEVIVPSDVIDDKKSKKKKNKDSEIDTKQPEEVKAPSDVVDNEDAKKTKSSENKKSVKSKKDKDSNQIDIEITELSESDSPNL